jgi:glycerol-3-phosphate dehydrogenase
VPLAPGTDFDLAVIGGGINGAGIARDAAGRGLSVLLCEQDDLASHTSSASTKLIHGGLRYLEFYEFGLVRKALAERELLLRAAPHLIRPLRFVMPHQQGMRPQWMIRAGLFLYDHLARRELLPASCGVKLAKHAAGGPLRPEFRRGFEYSDAWTDDARLVVACAQDAAERGATILTRARCDKARRVGKFWQLDLATARGRESHTARALVNAAGPWVGSLLTETLNRSSRHHLRLVKGSHIVVPALFEHPYAYIFQNPDGRIIFAIPYQERFTLIGTTEAAYEGDPAKVAPGSEEIDYLCHHASAYFRRPITPAEVVWHFSGVRPLLEDESSDNRQLTRDYLLEMDIGEPPLMTVFGGKLTTFRRLAEDAMNQLAPLLGGGPAWTATAQLPGGEMAAADFAGWLAAQRDRYPWLPAALLERYGHAYGSRIATLLTGANALADLGEEIAPGLFRREVDYLIHSEWARTPEDILWRRSKLGLTLSPDMRSHVIERLAALLPG